MKANANRVRLYGTMLAALLFTQAAYAFYNPSTGRWLSRDPLGEKGFEVATKIKSASRNGAIHVDMRGRPSRKRYPEMAVPSYVFLLNNGLDKVDLLGLKVTGATCTEEQVKVFQDGVNRMCAKILTPSTLRCCSLDVTVMQKLRKICNPDFKLIIRCLEANNEECREGTCAFVLRGGDFDDYGFIFICPDSWGKSPCGTTLDCITIHELLHGAGEQWDPNLNIQRSEKCLGCKPSYNGKWP